MIYMLDIFSSSWIQLFYHGLCHKWYQHWPFLEKVSRLMVFDQQIESKLLKVQACFDVINQSKIKNTIMLVTQNRGIS